MDCWKNGEFLTKEQVTISPYDHGYLYGLGFFETFRTYNGEVFLWEQHWERLEKTLSAFRIELTYTKQELLQVVQGLTRRNGDEDGYFRLNVSAGVHDIGLQPDHYPNPTVLVMRKALPPTVRGTEKTASWIATPRNSPEGPTRVKSHHYGNNVLARFELPSLAEQEGFMCTASGIVAEGITSSIFWVQNGMLYTPSLNTGILNSITRQWLIDYAHTTGIPVKEGHYSREQVEQADELWVVNAVQEIVPIRKLETYHFPGNNGEIYRNVHAAYVDALPKGDELA